MRYPHPLSRSGSGLGPRPPPPPSLEEEERQKVTRSTLVSIAKYAVAVALLIYLFATDSLKLGLLGKTLSESAPLVILSALIFVAVLQIGVLRWMMLSRAQGIRLSFGDACRLTFIGHFWNLAVPGAVGGDVVKAYYVASSFPDKKHEAFTAVALDRIVGLYGLFLLASITVGFSFTRIQNNTSMSVLATFILIVLAVATLGGTFFLSRWVRETLGLEHRLARLPLGGHLSRIADAVYVYRSHRGILFLTVVLSLICHTSLVLMIILCTSATLPDATVSPATCFFIGPIGLFANAVPLTPGGLGVGETAFGELMSAATDGEVLEGGNIFLLWRACAYIWMIPGLYFYLRGKGRIQQALREGEQDALESAQPKDPA